MVQNKTRVNLNLTLIVTQTAHKLFAGPWNETDKLKHFHYNYFKYLTVPQLNMISMAQVVEWKTGNPKVQGSHLTLQHFEVVCCWAWFTFNIKLLI